MNHITRVKLRGIKTYCRLSSLSIPKSQFPFCFLCCVHEGSLQERWCPGTWYSFQEKHVVSLPVTRINQCHYQICQGKKVPDYSFFLWHAAEPRLLYQSGFHESTGFAPESVEPNCSHFSAAVMKHLDQKRLRGEGFVRVYRGLTRRLPGREASSTPKVCQQAQDHERVTKLREQIGNHKLSRSAGSDILHKGCTSHSLTKYRHVPGARSSNTWA